MRDKRISRKRLEELDRILADRDKEILNSLQKCRYLTTGQIGRLHFKSNANKTAALRAANRVLVKLQDYGVIDALERRIGGVRAGSGAYVWFLTETGTKLLHINDTTYSSRKRFFEPSLNFLEHTLAVSESYVQIAEICDKYHLNLIKVEIEPVCWRGYIGEDGKPATLKPDLFTVIAGKEYEDSWFIEIDLSTESPCIILDKCQRYTHYYKSGLEQKQSGVFPLVVWIVPSTSRKENLQRNIAECKELHPKNIFIVITPSEFEELLHQGTEYITAQEKDKGENHG